MQPRPDGFIWIIHEICIIVLSIPVLHGLLSVSNSTLPKSTTTQCRNYFLNYTHSFRDTGTTLGLDGASWARIMIAAGNQTAEQLSLQFRTRIEEQIVLYTLLTNVADVHEVDNIRIVTALYLYNGSLVFTVENYIRNGVPVLALNTMTTKVNCISAYATCADTQWHQIRQQIVKNAILLFLDEQIPVKHLLPYSTHRLEFTEIYLGKAPPNDATNSFGPSLDSPHQPFRGCFRNVYQQGAQGKKYLLKSSPRQSTNLQLSTSARLGECDSTLLRPFPLWRIPNRSQYVTFTKPGAYIRIEGWKVVSIADISFHIVTSELDGILLYSSSVNEYDIYERFADSDQSTAITGAGEAGFDIFALELRNGKLVCTINTGSGSIQLGYSMLDSEQTLSSVLSNGEDHFVRVRFQEGSLKVEVDQKTYVSYKADEKIYKYLNLNGIFYIGGLPESIRQISSSISPEVWSARLRQNFVGCLGDVTVNNVQWDLDLEMRACWTQGLVERQCHTPTTSNWCANHECKNGGRCMNGWNRFTCDCSHTNFAGEFCSSPPLVASFNGHQWIRVKFASFPIHSSVENLIIRLRTKQKFGLVLTTRSPSVSASDCLELRLDNGYLLTTYDFGGQSKRYRSIIRVGDNKWHTVSIQRRDRQLNYTVDDSTQIFDIPKDGKFLSHKHIILGRAQVLYDEDSIEAFPNKHEFLAAKDTKFSVFIGHIMRFVFNGMDYLHVAKNLLSEPGYADLRTKLEMTASEGFYDTLMEFPLQFEVLDSYVDLDLSGNYDEFDVHFWIKANKNFGTILLFDGGPEDLFGLEIVNGKLHLVYLKQAESERIESKSAGTITDSEWHHLQVIRTSGASQSMIVRVDGEVTTTKLSNTRLSTKQHVYIGGLPLKSPKSQVYRNLLHSSSGFAGCVASISVNQSNPVIHDNNLDLTKGSDSRTREIGLFTGDPSSSTWHRAKVGCSLKSNEGRAASGHCTPRICQFDGRCVQQMGATICDCSMTSFTGRFCSEVSAALQISADPVSYITFDLNPVQNTTRDQLAFGVQVTKRGSKVLLFVKGHGESADYLEISVVSAKARHVILVRYNMGSGQQTLYEPDVDIADGRYHVVQFIRNGASGILRTDLEFERTNFPKVKSGTQFNGVHKIQLGMPTRTDEWKSGRRDQNSSEDGSEQSFEGFITGINFNEVDLIHVLKGAVIPGIFLSEQKNIRIQNDYQPNINHLKLAKKTRQETTSHLVANDMQLQSSDGPRRSDEFRSDPLIMARPDCPEPGELFDLTVCRPSDPNGIISPFIEFQKPSVLDEATKEQKQAKQDWNTHQNKLKQSLPNDSGSHIKSSPTEKMKNNKSPNPSKTSGDKILKNSDNEILIATPSDYDELINKQVHQTRWDDPRRTNQQARPAPEGPMKFVFNIGLIASVSVGGICLLLALVCIIYRCMRRDEGSYNVEESLAYTGEGSHAPTRMKRRSAPAEKISLSTLTPASSGRPLLEPEKPKQALLVSFADNCSPATSNVPLTIKLIPSPSPIQEDIVQPSPIKELEKKGTTLVKIETVEERKKPKSPKTVTDSQEWYV